MKKKLTKVLAMMLTMTVLVCVLPLVEVSAAVYTEGDFKYLIEDNKAILIDYKGSSPEVVIPSQLGSSPLVKIDYDTFRENEKITAVSIPEGVETIGAGAFYGCTNLKEITIPETVKSVAVNAFDKCNNLERVCIDNLKAWCLIDFSFSGANPLEFAKEFVVKGEVVKDLVITEDVKEIKDYTFAKHQGFESVSFPAVEIKIADKAFQNCDSITTVFSAMPKVTGFGGIGNISEIYLSEGTKSIENYAFHWMHSLKEVHLPESLETIGECAFDNCSALEKIEIPDNVTSVGNRCFNGCTSLERIDVGESLTSIGTQAFDGCTSLKEVHIKNLANWCSMDIADTANPLAYADEFYVNGEPLEKLAVPQGVKRIGWGIFEKYQGLTEVVLPEGVEYIGRYAFRNCHNLKKINLPEGITHIGYNAFENCTSLEEADIPSTVEFLGDYAFKGTAVRTANIPDAIIEGNNLCPGVFDNCSNLKKATVSWNGVTNFAGVFRDCENLNQLVLTETATQINFPNYLDYEERLVVVTFPANMNYIRPDAFRGCTNLSLIVFQGTPSQWDHLLESSRNTQLKSIPVMFSQRLLPGDANLDIQLSIQDATMIQKYTAQLEDISLAGKQAADANLDGEVNIKDATLVQKAIANLIEL